jgi:pyruvate dehydrogenase E1 component beta subunit
MAVKPYAWAVLEGVAQEMRSNPLMSFYWEYAAPVATLPTGEILDIAKEFGTPRTSGVGYAIDEGWIWGSAAGQATAGLPTIARVPSMASIYAIEYVFNQVGKLRHMTGGQVNMPLVLWVDGAGRTKGSAGQHTDVGQEAMYANIPGLKVVIPSNAYDGKGLMVAALRDPDPVIFYDYSEARSAAPVDVPDDAYTVPIGKAAVRQEGKDLTLVAWAPATIDVLKAMPELQKAGISTEFIDARTIKPLDVETIQASVGKTKRLLVVEHGHYTNGFSAHVVAEMAQRVPGARFMRLAFPDAPGPGDEGMMAWMRPDAPKILDAAKKLVAAA